MDNVITQAKEEITEAYEECCKTIIPTKKKKVYIVGFAPSWTETPWDDTEAEIWTLNEAYKLAEQQPKFRADRWFEIHNLDRPPKNDKKHIAWLQQCPMPIYTLQKWDFLPNAIPFPFYEISEWLKQQGHIGYRYFTNSISWMIAFAICEGFEEIHIYGVDMAVEKDSAGNAEYGYQKPSCEYIIGVGEKYAKMYVPETSDLLFCSKMYAVEMDNKNAVYYKKQIDQLTKRLQQIDATLGNNDKTAQNLEAQRHQILGAVDTYKMLLRKRLM
jgi:hypothetical protein